MIGKALFSTLILFTAAFSQTVDSRPCIGVTLPPGVEVGILSECQLPKSDVLKLFVRCTAMWAPSNGNNDVNSVVIISGQPGLRLKLLDNKIMPTAGFSINPILPFPLNGFDFGIGSFAGVGFRIKNIELGVYATTAFGENLYISKIGVLSASISKSFEVD